MSTELVHPSGEYFRMPLNVGRAAFVLAQAVGEPLTVVVDKKAVEAVEAINVQCVNITGVGDSMYTSPDHRVWKYVYLPPAAIEKFCELAKKLMKNAEPIDFKKYETAYNLITAWYARACEQRLEMPIVGCGRVMGFNRICKEGDLCSNCVSIRKNEITTNNLRDEIVALKEKFADEKKQREKREKREKRERIETFLKYESIQTALKTLYKRAGTSNLQFTIDNSEIVIESDDIRCYLDWCEEDGVFVIDVFSTIGVPE